MSRTSASFVLAFALLCGLFFGPTRAGAARAAREQQQEQDEEESQPPKSRSFGDNFWKENRRKAPKPPKPGRKRYERIGVASNSTTPIKYHGPNHWAASGGRRRKPPQPATTTWQDVPFETSEQVGLTIWRLRRCAGAGGPRCFLELQDGLGRGFKYEAVRVSTDDDFRGGDGIQLAVESRVPGFVYVLHQEVRADGSTGEPKLLFPLREGANVVGPGRPLLIPAQGADGEVKVLKMRNETGKRLKSERLRIIVVPRPLDGVFVEDRPRYISDADVRDWESRWSGRLELFDLSGGGDENMSLNEWYAMRGGATSRDLTTEDLAPQKLYVVDRRRNDGVLFTIELPYVN
jgi:hypothetical protein